MAIAIKSIGSNPVADVLKGLPTVTATALKNNFGKVMGDALRGGVTIMRHNRPQFVLLSVEQFADLQLARSAPLEALTAEFDTMVAGMQKPAARRGVAKLFKASPADLGRAAVKGARGR